MWKPKSPTFLELLFVLALTLLLFRLGIALFEYARLARAALTFPFPLDYGEGPILDQTLRLAHFENIYRIDFATPPFTVSNYPPLFHLLQTPFALIFGPAFWYGRAISVLSALTAALMLGLILHALTADRVASIIAGMMLLSFPYVMQWSVFDRVDTLALALSLGGLYAVVRESGQGRGAWIASVLFTAAVYTKQSYALVAPLTAFVWLLQLKRRQQALRLAAITVGSCLGLFFLLTLFTRGGFYLNLIVANLNSFSWHTVTRHLIDLYMHAAYLLIGVFVFIVVERLERPTRSWPLVAPYLLAAMLSFIAVGKAGSSVNYLYEAVAALCLATGALVAWARDHQWLRILVVLLLFVQVGGILDWARGVYIPFVMDKVSNYGAIEQMAEIVRQARSPVLADEYMGLIPLTGRRLYFQPFEFKQLAEAGLWDERALVAQIQGGEFGAILFYEPRHWHAIIARWTPAQRNAVYASYRLEKTLVETFVYLPK